MSHPSLPTGKNGRPLRVLMIAPTSFFADYGCHVRILEESRFLRSQGCQVVVCTYAIGRDPEDLEIHRAWPVPWRVDYEVGSSKHKIAMDLLLILACFWSMLRFRPDVIHGHIHEGALIGMLMSFLFRCPLVSDLQGSLTGEMVDHHFVTVGSAAHRVFRWLEGVIDRHAGRLLTSTNLYATLLVREFGCRQDRVTYVPDCVNTNVFAPQERDADWWAYRRALGIPEGRKVVVYLGLLAHYQGIDHLLRAAAMLCERRSDLHFLIAGFPNVEHYRSEAARLGIGDHCTFPGKVAYDQAPRMLGQGDVAVSPKLSATEGAGKLLNYMALGLPVVAFGTTVSREYLGDTGLYAIAADSSDLARCIQEALDNPAHAELGARLRARAMERYDWSSSGGLILDAYAKQLGSQPSN
ncbi:MAG: glycosyltransferase family 4 protein [Anaerolineae bacterium]|jgi:glycosyltransferase involved in cell wall biosynthesis|nr:glycosyltransferase family 4 protein [Chloroflexota bacterium]